jgi:uncharacterized protein
MDVAKIPANPVAEADPSGGRLLAIDVTRGFALLGIFFVNIQAFGEPFGRFIAPVPESNEPLTVFWFYLVHMFCMGKFYPLFSMLFGMGLSLQMNSVFSRTGEFGGFYALYVRRLLWLFVMGLSHALLLWYGDILFIYSLAGAVLLACARLRPHVQLAIGIALLLIATTLQTGFNALGGWAASQKQHDSAPSFSPTVSTGAAVSEATEPVEPPTPIRQLVQGIQAGGPESPDWLEAELRAYRDGPWVQSFMVRGISWLFYAIFCVLGFGWHVLGMFFIGAALLRLGVLDEANERVQWILLSAGGLVGIPAVVTASLLPAFVGFNWWSAAVSAFYLMSFTLLVRHGLARTVTFVLSNVGRMALTNYLTQTLVSTFVFYHWGFAQFGAWTRPERCGFVLAVFAFQCIFSVLWMRTFRFGPAEWVWRSVTYFSPQPMLRSRCAQEAV